MNVSGQKQFIKSNETLPVKTTSNFFYCEFCSDKLRLRFQDGSSIEIKTGKKIKLQEPVNAFYLENTSDKEVYIEYVCGFGDVSDDSMKLEGSISVYSGNSILFDSADLSLSINKIVDFNKVRNAIILQNNSDKDIWVGGNNLNIEKKNGYKIVSGGMLSLAVKSELYAISTSETKLSIVEILES